jgi:hypothetical protein
VNLPKFRETVKIKFWSLRPGLGANLGVIFDMDTQVEREAYRVRTDDDWKWQIKGLRQLKKYDYYAEEDQYILDDCGSSIEIELQTINQKEER